MMRNPEQTIGKLAGKATLTVLRYLDAHGFPTSRAMLAPRERDGSRVF